MFQLSWQPLGRCTASAFNNSLSPAMASSRQPSPTPSTITAAGPGAVVVGQRQLPMDIASLTGDQLECLCLALENWANFDRLAFLLDGAEQQAGGLSLLTAESDGQRVLLRAKALLLFHQGQFAEFKQHIRTNRFAQRDHALLQRLWNEANYAEAEQQRSKRLDPVSRYRIRKKNAFPASIWDGEDTSYCFKTSARNILRRAYQLQTMPSQSQKAELARQTGLNVLQVSNWFKNQRQRARQHQRQQRIGRAAEHRRMFSVVDDDDSAGEEEENCYCGASDGTESEDQQWTTRNARGHGQQANAAASARRSAVAVAGTRRLQHSSPPPPAVGHFPGGDGGYWAAAAEEGRQQRRRPNGGGQSVDLAKSGRATANVYLAGRR